MPAQTLIKTTLPSGKHQCPRRQPHTKTYTFGTQVHATSQIHRYTDTQIRRYTDTDTGHVAPNEVHEYLNEMESPEFYAVVLYVGAESPGCVRAHNHFDGHVKFKLKSLERWQTTTHLPKARKNT